MSKIEDGGPAFPSNRDMRYEQEFDREGGMTLRQYAAIKMEAYRAMVDRFLSWKLPQDFGPDAGISFTPPPHLPDLYWPTGTNLFHAGQALEMFKHCVELPSAAAVRLAERDALAAKLAELEGQEPVAWRWRRKGFEVWTITATRPSDNVCFEDQPLYTQPVNAEEGFVTITTTEDGRRVMVSRQDEDHRIPKVLWEAKDKPTEFVNARLLEALKRLSFCAQTTGGVAGRDDELCSAIEASAKAIAEAEAQQERILQDMHDAGREIDRVMAEAAPKAVRLTEVEVDACFDVSDGTRVGAARAIETAVLRKNGIEVTE